MLNESLIALLMNVISASHSLLSNFLSHPPPNPPRNENYILSLLL
jgi:hypothetical protein